MKKFIFSLAFITLASWGFGQKTASDKAVDMACNCFKKVDATKVKTTDKKKEVATKCITEAMLSDIEGLAKEYGIAIEDFDEETGRKIGEKFGMKLGMKCAEALPYAAALNEGESTEANTAKIKGYESEGQTTGTFVRMDVTGETVKIILKNAENEEETYYWIRKFPGSDNLETTAKRLGGKKVTITWGEFEKFNFKLRGYGKEREITAFKIEE